MDGIVKVGIGLSLTVFGFIMMIIAVAKVLFSPSPTLPTTTTILFIGGIILICVGVTIRERATKEEKRKNQKLES